MVIKKKGHDFVDDPSYLILQTNQKLKQRWDTETHDFPSETTTTETSKNILILGPSHVTDCAQIDSTTGRYDLPVAAQYFKIPPMLN